MHCELRRDVVEYFIKARSYRTQNKLVHNFEKFWFALFFFFFVNCYTLLLTTGYNTREFINLSKN